MADEVNDEVNDDNAGYIVTPEFRLSFPDLFELNKNQKYGLVMLFDAGTDISELKRIAKEALVAKFGKKLPKDIRNPFRSGEEKEYYEDDQVWARAVTTYQPAVVDDQGQEILEAKKVYGGQYAKAYINAYAYEYQGKKGVAFGLESVQIARQGEPFGKNHSASAAKAVFGTVESAGDNPGDYEGGDEAGGSDGSDEMFDT